eukprot:2753136-Rhodomonas_salina.1
MQHDADGNLRFRRGTHNVGARHAAHDHRVSDPAVHRETHGAAWEHQCGLSLGQEQRVNGSSLEAARGEQ